MKFPVMQVETGAKRKRAQLQEIKVRGVLFHLPVINVA